LYKVQKVLWYRWAITICTFKAYIAICHVLFTTFVFFQEPL
jgi:hypothetical protein